MILVAVILLLTSLCYLRRQTLSVWILNSSFHVRIATSMTNPLPLSILAVPPSWWEWPCWASPGTVWGHINTQTVAVSEWYNRHSWNYPTRSIVVLVVLCGASDTICDTFPKVLFYPFRYFSRTRVLIRPFNHTKQLGRHEQRSEEDFMLAIGE